MGSAEETHSLNSGCRITSPAAFIKRFALPHLQMFLCIDRSAGAFLRFFNPLANQDISKKNQYNIFPRINTCCKHIMVSLFSFCTSFQDYCLKSEHHQLMVTSVTTRGSTCTARGATPLMPAAPGGRLLTSCGDTLPSSSSGTCRSIR